MHLAHNRGRRYVRYLLGVVLCVATVATSQGGDGRSPLLSPHSVRIRIRSQSAAASRHPDTRCVHTLHLAPGMTTLLGVASLLACTLVEVSPAMEDMACSTLNLDMEEEVSTTAGLEFVLVLLF